MTNDFLNFILVFKENCFQRLLALSLTLQKLSFPWVYFFCRLICLYIIERGECSPYLAFAHSVGGVVGCISHVVFVYWGLHIGSWMVS